MYAGYYSVDKVLYMPGRICGLCHYNKCTHSDSDNTVAQVSQIHLCLCVVPLLGQTGPPASGSLCSHSEDRDGLKAGRLQRRARRHVDEVCCVAVLAAGQLQLLTHRHLQENTSVSIEDTVEQSISQKNFKLLLSS